MNRVLISIGSFNIYWYSVCILFGVLIATYLIIRESKKYNLQEYMENLIFLIIIIGIIGARIYYVAFNFGIYQNDLLNIFKIWEGGLAIYGGIIFGILTIIYYAKKNNQNILKTTDIIVPGVILAQAIGRWGNFFNQEAYGIKTTLEILQNLHIPNFIINGMYINGMYYHPTFLYESLWCILGFLLLIILRKIINNKTGILTYSYFIWYGIGRFFIEGLRTDSLYLGMFRISQIVSIVLVITGILGIINIIKKKAFI